MTHTVHSHSRNKASIVYLDAGDTECNHKLTPLRIHSRYVRQHREKPLHQA